MESEVLEFSDLLEQSAERGGFSTDDLLASVLPLMRQVLALHDGGKVAPLNGCEAIHVSHGVLWFQEAASLEPSLQQEKIEVMSANESSVVEIMGREDRRIDLDESSDSSVNLQIHDSEAIPLMPVYLIGHESWEHRIGHHDALTDIFSLGMLLGSLAMGLDFSVKDELKHFVDSRDVLHQQCETLHPVVVSMVMKMTSLERHDRVQDLRSVIEMLENYRDVPNREEMNLVEVGSVDASKRQQISKHLRDRLFDLSKRNKLLYFKANMSTVNLTVSSVPLMLDFKHIRAESLCIWQPQIEEALKQEKAIPLNRYLRFEDAPYLPNSLDSLRREANRQKKEYGFSELRLVIAFFRWHNLKEDKDTRIESPLLLQPVELKKVKGVRDRWMMEPVGTQVDVNPVLRYQLKQLYDLDLPETMDLNETSVEDFYQQLKQQIQASEPAVDVKMIDKPQIDLVKQRAHKKLNAYLKRRRLTGRSVRKYDEIEYSYSEKSYQPLGLQLFLKRVKPPELPLEYLINEKPSPRTPELAAQGTTREETERETYVLRQGSEKNPYVWDFDLCSLTLANFSYRKMSLVRDYNALLQADRVNPVFDAIFSLAPKQVLEEKEALPLGEQFLIVPADPTQVSTIAAARSGENLIIQGPPGTGKSQTITNLIADFVATGKRVLFVCEKRAALDVVYQRLAASDLDVLTCLIHDSQADKKDFIHDLKATYEKFLAIESESKTEKQAKRKLRVVEKELASLGQFSEAMQQVIGEQDSEQFLLRDLYNRLIELRAEDQELDAGAEEMMPSYAEWLEHGESVKNVANVLEDLASYAEGKTFAETGFKSLRKEVYLRENPVSTLRDQVEVVKHKLAGVENQLEEFSFNTKACTLLELRNLSFIAESVRYLARNELLTLLDDVSDDAHRLKQHQQAFKKQQYALQKAASKNSLWSKKLEPRDTEAALAQVLGFEEKVTRFFSPSFWRMRKLLNKNYQFSAHAVAPKWSQVLEDLVAEHQEQAKLSELEEAVRQELGADDISRLVDGVSEFKARKDAVHIDAEDSESFEQCLLRNDEAARKTVDELSRMHDELLELDKALEAFLVKSENLEVDDLSEVIEAIEQDLPMLPELLNDLQDLANAPERVFDSVRTMPFHPEAYECACAKKTLHEIYRAQRDLQTFEGWMLRKHKDAADKNYQALQDLNGGRIVDVVSKHFRDLYDLANRLASKLDEDGKKFKRSFNAGRRELEHEFGKSMRYKSIRDLATGDSGQVVLALKPVWLMSPLSISDAMPLEDDQFDVVIFDEASQIRLEEAVPAVQRGKQVIVVGDEMQLPPTTFFSAGSADDEEFVDFQEEGTEHRYDLSSDSFLTHVAMTLPSKMLGWHYRSRYEALISFSNHYFYGGKLITIPDRSLPLVARNEISVRKNLEEGESEKIDFAEEILSRSISFHHLEEGIYAGRQNAAEAEHIAELVRDLLHKESGKSMGIVAFSEAQQGRIEIALRTLAIEDPEFGRRLSIESDREDDGQHVGLFVKNLENVQGDERDIMILSICYAPDAKGKMRMNFGPINRSGGEKRLNVIFSRAKYHMAIVSSIKSNQITNDYNDGANCLKKFLEYAESVSKGDQQLADHVLTQRGETTIYRETDALQLSIRDALIEKGYTVDMNVGESAFICDLSVRKTDDTMHQLAVLLDSRAHYQIETPLERYVLRTAVLKAFGWDVIEVFAKDWYHDPEQVLISIDRRLS